MTKQQLLDTISKNVTGYIDFNAILTAVESYSGASNGAKPLVSGSFTVDDMRKAFLAGRDSVEAELRYEHFGDMDAYASKKIVKSFKTFIHENYR